MKKGQQIFLETSVDRGDDEHDGSDEAHRHEDKLTRHDSEM